MIRMDNSIKRIAIAGEIYSANIGDQAIYASLAFLLKKTKPSITIVPIDISGRQRKAIASQKSTLTQRIALLQSNPVVGWIFPFANIAFQGLKLKRKLLLDWKASLESVDLLVLGGGQLLFDNALGFPLKLYGVTKLARSLGIPYHISACGVGKSWSLPARSLFRQSISHARTITVRDNISGERLGVLMPEVSPLVSFDPAIWARSVFPTTQGEPRFPKIGLGVINHHEAKLHLARKKQYSSVAWINLWLDIIAGLSQKHQQVELFTTGSPFDYEFAARLLSLADAKGIRGLGLAPQPAQPSELVNTLKAYKLVIAARLHASILSNAFGISSIGLSWDEKVLAYYDDIGLGELCFDLSGLNPAEVASTSNALFGKPFPPKILNDCMDKALLNARSILNPSGND